MKKFYRALASIMALTAALVLFSVVSFAGNVTETKNYLESGVKKTVNLTDYGDTADYKINVSESGSLKLSITSYSDYFNIYVCDSNGADVKPIEEKISIGKTSYYKIYGFNKLIWNGAMEKCSATISYEVQKGTYYLRFEQKGLENVGKTVFTAIYPSSNKTDSNVKINYVSIPLKKGESLQLSAVLSAKTSEKVKWSSSNKSVATVSSKGKITGKSEGTAIITAKIGESKYKIYIQVVG